MALATACARASQSPLGVFEFPPEQADKWPVTTTRSGPAKLEQSRAAGLQVLLALTGAKKNYSDRWGCFDLRLWKQELDRHDASRIQSFVATGTVIGLYAIDEPHDWFCGPSFAEIDAACAYANLKWPALPCGVNAPPGWLQRGRDQLRHLGFLFFQYSSRRGDPGAWLERQLKDAAWFKGDVWLSIQILRPQLSVEEFRQAGVAMCQARPRGLMLWKWSDAWFAQAGVREALAAVAHSCGGAQDMPVNRN